MPRIGEEPRYLRERRDAARLKEEGENNERNLAAINRIAGALVATQGQEQTDDDKRTRREKATIGHLIVTVFLTFIADVIFYDTLKDAHKASREQLRRLDVQLGLMADSSRQTDTQIAITKNLATAAKDQADAAREGAAAARENTVAGSRAWVGPNGATVDNTPSLGNPVNFAITYQNSGRTPATNMAYTADPFVVTVEEDKAGVTNAKLFNNLNKCLAGAISTGSQVVYPSTGFASNQLTLTLDKSLVDDKVVGGDKLIGVIGCMTYETFKTPHHSTFCFFYRAGKTKVPNLNYCPGGGYAD